MDDSEITNTEDQITFGNQWIYCAQHLTVHKTGWCTVSVIDKIALGVNTQKDGIEKCRRLGLKLYKDTE